MLLKVSYLLFIFCIPLVQSLDDKQTEIVIETGGSGKPSVAPTPTPPSSPSQQATTTPNPQPLSVTTPATTKQPSLNVTISLDTSKAPANQSQQSNETSKPVTDVVIKAKDGSSGSQQNTTTIVQVVSQAGCSGKFSKFCEYLKPVCDSLTKLNDQQIAKVQAQLKLFAEKTNGKLDDCFKETYQIDPKSTPVSKEHLEAICLSRNLAPDQQFSYGLFEKCAIAHWQPAVEAALEKIIVARINCTDNHQHPADDGKSYLDHDEDVSYINEVVSQVFDNDKSFGSDIKVIDISGSAVAHKEGMLPLDNTGALVENANSQTISPSGLTNRLNDPNTVIVLYDNSTTASPSNLAAAAAAANTTTTSTTTTTKPATVVKIETVVATTTPSPPTTSKPTTTSAPTTGEPKIGVLSTILPKITTVSPSSTTNAPTLEDQVKITINGSNTKVEASLPSLNLTTTLAPSLSTTQSPTTSAPASNSSKVTTERKLIAKTLKEKQSELDAQNAIQALQKQREATNHKTDGRLHQLEHQRQMAIDPIGHSIKHQQYELKKQQKLAAAAASTSSGQR